MRERAVGHRLQPLDALGRALRIGARGLLAGEQFFTFGFGLLAIMNICRCSAPIGDPAPPVTDWDRARQVPTILAVPATDTVLNLARLTGLDRLCPMPQREFAVVRVKTLHPTGHQGLLPGSASIFLPPQVGVIPHSVGAAGVNDLRHGVRELAEARLALAQR